MSEAKSITSRRVEATTQIKALARRCVREGLTAAEVTYVSQKVREQLGEYLRRLGGKAAMRKPTVSSEQDAGQDIVEENLHLRRFADQYKRFSSYEKARCPWQEVRERLLKNNGHYLALAQALNLGGILFGVDREGNPLFADSGEGPIMTGMNYRDTRNAVYLKNPEGEWTADNMIGYEMFPYAYGNNKSCEILAFEKFTGKPFVVSPDRAGWRASWLESGENSAWPRYVEFNPHNGGASVDYFIAWFRDPTRGVRRLLRVQES